MLLLSSADFFLIKINFFQKIFKNILKVSNILSAIGLREKRIQMGVY